MEIWGLIEEYASTRVQEERNGNDERVRAKRQQIKKEILEMLRDIRET
jgi:hypothetical protein